MEKTTTKFQFKLKEELCVTTTEKCGEEMTPTMRVIKKCTDFIDKFYHGPDDEYEIKYATHTKEPDGKRETFAVNFSYIDEEGNTFASYSYFVVYSVITKTIQLDITVRNKNNVNVSDIVKKLGEISDDISDKKS
jgi:hypothetical protein